jgi:hypothetical protein
MADQHASLTIAQGLDSTDAQSGSQQAFEGAAGRSAAHNVPKCGGTKLETCPLLIRIEISEDFGSILFDAFGNHHDCMRLAALECGAQPLRDLATPRGRSCSTRPSIYNRSARFGSRARGPCAHDQPPNQSY